MKIFETPVLNIKEFNKVNILTVSGETEGKTAVQAANARLQEVDPTATVLDFVLS